MTIRGFCKVAPKCPSRYSDRDVKWPTSFVAVPRKGERVRAINGHELGVIRVTHLGVGYMDYRDGETNSEPMIEVIIG